MSSPTGSPGGGVPEGDPRPREDARPPADAPAGGPVPPDALDDAGAVYAAQRAFGGTAPDTDAQAAVIAGRIAGERAAERAAEEEPAPGPVGARMARNTAIFSIATGLSRIAGLAREIVAARYFGTSGAASSFTIAFQVPNLVRGLFADAALSAAFVPVFTEFLEHRKRREAFLLASTLFWIILLVLGAITAFFILAAPVVMPLFVPGADFGKQLTDLTVGLSQVLFPVVVLLGLNGLLVGIANAYNHFTIPAIAPLVWNLVIIGALIALRPLFSGDEQIYAYAIGVLAGTIVQLLMIVPVLRRLDVRLAVHLHWRDEGVGRVFRLMLPVTIGLGIINVNLVINSVIGSLISESAPRAIDAAFRVYMLPQGMVSVALATVLFPALSRLVARADLGGLRTLLGTGVRQNVLLLVPAAACTAVLAEPIVRLIYQYGSFDATSTDEVAQALFWFSFSLPFAGVNLLLTRTFFSLQRPWRPTLLAAGNLLLTLVVSLALYEPLGIAGPVIGTVIGTAGMTFAQAVYLRRSLHGSIEGRATLRATLKVLAATGVLAIVAYGVWFAIDRAVGDAGVLARALSVLPALAAGLAAYAAVVLALRVPEAAQIRDFLTRRLRRGR